jgi:hypothetical protein
MMWLTGSAESTMNSTAFSAAEYVPATDRRQHFLHRAPIAISIMQAA